MEITESLTKENLWNDLYKAYPKGTQVFCDWIDEYKKAANWGEVLGSHIKFHDLPHAMQMGIWILFLAQNGFLFYFDDIEEFGLAYSIRQQIKVIEIDEIN